MSIRSSSLRRGARRPPARRSSSPNGKGSGSSACRSEDGSSCWGTSEHRSGEWQLTNYVCETQFNRFPDPAGPVLVLSRGGIIPGTQLRTFDAFHGLAADGVRRVGVIDAQDRLVPMADVRGNAFSADAPSDRIKAIVALDEQSEVSWRSAPIPLPDE